MNTQNKPKHYPLYNCTFSKEVLVETLNDLGSYLDEVEHQLLASNEKNNSLTNQINDLNCYINDLHSKAKAIKDKTKNYFNEKQEILIALTEDYQELNKQHIAVNEKNKRSVAQISVLEDRLMNSQESALYWQERHRLMHEEYKEEFRINSELNKKLIDANEKNNSSFAQIKCIEDQARTYYKDAADWQEKYTKEFFINSKLNKEHKELTAYYEAAESDNERLVDALAVEQNKNKTLENKIIELSTNDIKDQPEVKQGINLTQSEVDFLKSYLSNCITESQEDIDLLKDTAKSYKFKSKLAKTACYKEVNKLQKKIKVLSVIQHKLKKTVLSRKETKDEFLGFNRKDYENAWYSVVDALNAAHPNFFQHEGTGEQCAVKAILKLGKDSQRLKEIKEMLNKA